MSEPKLYTRKEAAKLTGLSTQTIYNYARLDKIKYTRTPTGRYLYDISSLRIKSEEKEKNKYVIAEFQHMVKKMIWKDRLLT